MMHKAALAAILALLPLPALGQALVEEVPPADIAAKVAAATAAADAGGQGPFAAEMVSDPLLPTHTIYRPRNLARAGKLPIVAWANGACTNIGNRFRYFLTEVASHGYLVIAIGPVGPHTAEWKTNLDVNNPLPPSERTAPSFAQQMTDAIDWSIVENARPGSAYRGKLGVRSIAVMGQSCGGLQTISAAADPRVTTAVVWNSGTFPEGRKPLMGTADAIKASLRRIHVPVAWISGDESDQAYPNANDDYAAFNHAPALRVWHKGTGHSAHWRDPHGGVFTPLGIAWLDWQLKRRRAASSLFMGPDCALCKTEGWFVQSKGFAGR